MKALILLLSLSILSGCATDPFAKHYQSYTNQMPASLTSRLLPPSSSPQIATVPLQDYKNQARKLEEQGFVVLGMSSFWGYNPNQEQLVKQARRVGADFAVWTSEYSHTHQGVRPIFSYQPGQTYTTTHYGTANASVYGTGGYASGYGSYSGYSTTTTPGTMTTQYVPYQQRVYNHGATYWRRTKTPVFGATLIPLPDELRKSLERNTGVYVSLVRIDGPAFRSNVMEGDVIVQANDQPIAVFSEMMGFLESHAGERVKLKLLRNGRSIEVEVQLNPKG